MRTKYAIKNISVNIFSQIILILLGFISRKVFLDSLGSEYLGINGLLGNVLSAMVIIESGMGISIVYNLYKPLAKNDTEQVIALIQLYKRVYYILAGVLFIISLGLYPFLNKLIIYESNISHTSLVYFLFVGKSILSYLYAHKLALINADQKGYKIAKNNLLFQVISIIIKILILLITENYVAYLTIEFGINLLQNIINSMIVNRHYPYIKTKIKYSVNKDINSNIKTNVKAMFIQNIGSYTIYSTDNILISTFINLSTVGLYSNYTMIIDQLNSLVSSVINGIGNSVGNLIATENENKSYSIFNICNLIAFWIYSVSTIFLFNLLEPFISWWLGEHYIMDKLVLIVLLINFYIGGMRSVILTFKNKAGMFAKDKYAPVMEGVINIVLSIILIKYFDLVGVFLGTILSYLSISFWNQPRILFKHYFGKQVSIYFLQYIKYVFIMLFAGYITTLFCNTLKIPQIFICLVIKGIICILVPSIVYIILMFKNADFKYILDLVILSVNKLLNKSKYIVNNN